MIGALAIGVFSAVLVFIPLYLLRFSFLVSPSFWFTPELYLFLGFFAAGFEYLISKRKRHSTVLGKRYGRIYEGLPDLMIHIHFPSESDSSLFWAFRGAISFCLNLFGAVAGTGGAGMEFAQALLIRTRPTSSRWFQQRRRTDAACSLASGISAAFGAPFAGTFFPTEYGVGGKMPLSLISALSAFLSLRFLLASCNLDFMDLRGVLYGFRFVRWEQWAAIFVLAIAAGAIGTLLIWGIRFLQKGFRFKKYPELRFVIGGVLFWALFHLDPMAHTAPWTLLEEVLWGRTAAPDVLIALFAQAIFVLILFSTFGTLSTIWPVFVLGACFGVSFNSFVLAEVPGLAPVAGFAGAAAVFGAVLGAPLSAAIICFELTQNIQVLLPCVVAALIAREVRNLLRTRSVTDQSLTDRGLVLVDGRSKEVLEGISVKEAMVTDHETVYEHMPIEEIHSRLMTTKYPFLPVTTREGVYRGLLTLDLVQAAWETQRTSVSSSHSPLTKLLEAKDLLYRSGFKAPVIREGERLSATGHLFDTLPCATVLSDREEVRGLLFVHGVRLAYDREEIRRSLMND